MSADKPRRPMKSLFAVTPEGLEALSETDAFQNLDAEKQSLLMELLPDVLGGAVNLEPATLEKGLKKVQKFSGFVLEAPVRKAISSALSKRNALPTRGTPKILEMGMTVKAYSSQVPALRDDVLENFVSFFSGDALPGFGLGGLKNGYKWLIPEPPYDHIENWPKGEGYKPNVDLKLRLHELWLDPQVDRLSLAIWIISDWGKVRGNKPETLSRYVKMAEEDDPVTPIAGVASYSKLLSIAHPEKSASTTPELLWRSTLYNSSRGTMD